MWEIRHVWWGDLQVTEFNMCCVEPQKFRAMSCWVLCHSLHIGTHCKYEYSCLILIYTLIELE